MRRLQDLTRVCRALAQQGTRSFSSVPAGEVAVANGLPSVGPRRVFISASAKTAGQHGILLTAESEWDGTGSGGRLLPLKRFSLFLCCCSAMLQLLCVESENPIRASLK